METTISNDQGVVIKKIYSQYHVRAGGRILPCVPSTRRLKPDSIAVGDRVCLANIGNGEGKIIEVLPRNNHFSRPGVKSGMNTREQVIVSNIDQVVPVFSIACPIPKWGLLDRYLAAAEAAGLPPRICISKIDLSSGNTDVYRTLDEYRAIGYQILWVSALTGAGIPELSTALQNKVSVLVGKSGVGKTSLLNALQPELRLPVRSVTQGKKGKGRHTTTHFEMYALDGGGAVIDTPGIREFGLWDIYADELADYFPEMQTLVGSCKFGLDCSHDEEPGCAIRAAVMAGEISPRRYRSYMRLREELP